MRGRWLPKNKAGVRWTPFEAQENRRLDWSSLLACHQAACEALRERRSKKWSGRRGSNPRQPAWKAVCHRIAARLLSTGSASASSTHYHFSRTNGIVCRIHFEAVCHSHIRCCSDYTRSPRKKQGRQYVYCSWHVFSRSVKYFGSFIRSGKEHPRNNAVRRFTTPSHEPIFGEAVHCPL